MAIAGWKRRSTAVLLASAKPRRSLQSLLKAEDWQSLASLPAEAFMRRIEDRMSDARSASDIAIRNQQAFASGLQQALEAWQKAVADAMRADGSSICPLCRCRTSSSSGCPSGRRRVRTRLRPRAARRHRNREKEGRGRSMAAASLPDDLRSCHGRNSGFSALG